MSTVYASATMSLDGYIAGPDESGFDRLFRWYRNGEVAVSTANPNVSMQMTPDNADHFRGLIDQTGVLVVGRKLFDVTNGWDGAHPIGVPVIVMSHTVPAGWPRADAPFTFVSDGIASAIAQAKEIAGDKLVGVNGGTIARQCLEAGLLDEIWVDLAPVLLGAGTPFFDQLTRVPVDLEEPTVTPGKGAVHLRYRVRR